MQLIGGSASSQLGVGPVVATGATGVGEPGAGELVLLVECNRKRCRGSWRVQPGQQLPVSCPRCGRFDW